jgi:hypothetical protein
MSPVRSFAGLLLLISTTYGWGAISFGPFGFAPITFDTQPAADAWTTQRIPGASIDIVSVAALDAAIQTNSASSITNPLAVSGTAAPQAPAVWNSQQKNIFTGPAGIAAQMLMATLQNDSGADVHSLTLAYDFGIGNYPGTYPDGDQVPGQCVYFSLTGDPYSWQLIPEITGLTNPGPRNVTLNLPTWPAGTRLYLLWAQDNAARSPDSCYTIDNFSASPFIIDYFPTLFITPTNGGSGVRVTWTYAPGGVLQYASSLQLPIQWHDLPGASSGFTTNTTNGTLFFRLRR